MSMQAVSVEPIRRTVSVARSVEDAFTLFTEQLASWWPLSTHSYGGDEAEAATFEPRVGGRVYERQRDGTERDWGVVTVWEPPKRFVLAWEIARPTEVEVRFVAVDGGTRVELEHRGWERAEENVREQHESYSGGWTEVLGRFRTAAR